MEGALEQVLVRSRGGRVELQLVVLGLAGALRRDRLTLPTADPREALMLAARHLVTAGEVRDLSGTRLRVERAGGLVDDASLLEHFRRAFEEARDVDRHPT